VIFFKHLHTKKMCNKQNTIEIAVRSCLNVSFYYYLYILVHRTDLVKMRFSKNKKGKSENSVIFTLDLFQKNYI